MSEFSYTYIYIFNNIKFIPVGYIGMMERVKITMKCIYMKRMTQNCPP